MKVFNDAVVLAIYVHVDISEATASASAKSCE